jgi:hypothetical protein
MDEVKISGYAIVTRDEVILMDDFVEKIAVIHAFQ